jgi:uncharacterized protein
MSAAAEPNDSPESPCTRRCCLDDDDVCMGCGRSLEEIVAWSGSSDAEKREILVRSRRRAAAYAHRHDPL